MNVRASSLDDLLNVVFTRLLARGRSTVSSKGSALEMSGVVLELANPRARLSKTESRALLFSWLGELSWYLSGSDSLQYIRYYLKKYPEDAPGVETVRSAYGPRLRKPGKDQLAWIVQLLTAKPQSRRAVIPIYGIQDTETQLPEVPCTCTLQFLLRQSRLEMITHMRSNDAFVGLPGDIFAFTMIQELVATALNASLGKYKHMVGSLHLYQCDRQKAERYLQEGWHLQEAMPAMPIGSQFPNLEKVLGIERSLREQSTATGDASLPEYWQDIVRLLKIFHEYKVGRSTRRMNTLRREMRSNVFRPFIEKKRLQIGAIEEEGITSPVLDLFRMEE